MPQFVHLHVHTQYSILDGQASVQRLVDKAMADGQPGIAVTDHGDMFGIKEFYNYVQKVKGKCKDKAAVIGDTVGDPFKDTSGPSLNILIQLCSTVSIVFSGLITSIHLLG